MAHVLLAELTAALAQHSNLRVRPSVEMDDGAVVLTIRVVPEEQPDTAAACDVLELFHALQWAEDLAQMRGFAERYGIQPEALEALLPAKESA